MRLEVGDIVLGRPGKSPGPGIRKTLGWLMSLAVVRFQALFGDPAEFSHVGIVSRDGDTEAGTRGDVHRLGGFATPPYVTEALARVETEPWSKNWAGRSFAVYRYRRVDPLARAIVRAKAHQYTGRRYGWWKLLFIAADAWLSHTRGVDTRLFSRLLHRDREPVCSYLVQRIADEAWAERFGVPMGSAQPDDIGDWCAAKTAGLGVWLPAFPLSDYVLVYDTDARPESFQRFIIPPGTVVEV